MLKKPIFLTLILNGIPAILVTLFSIIHTFTGIFISFITDIACIFLVSWLYFNKYNESIPKYLRFLTAMYCSTFSPLLLLFFANVRISPFFMIITTLNIATRFVYIYFGLDITSKFIINRQNYANNKSQLSVKDLEPDEKIVYRAKKYSISSIINELIALVLLFAILKFQAPYLWKMGIDGKLFLIGGLVYCIVMQIDRCFISDLLVTNKRIIFKRIQYLSKIKDILLDEIKEVKSSKARLGFGIITVTSQKGFSLRSSIVINPIDLQENIEKYLEEIKKPIPDILD